MNTKNLFLRMGFIAVRDKYSYEKCKEWGIKNIKLYSDLCFLMNDEIKLKKTKNNIKKIGIIVRDWPHTKNGAAYYEKILPLKNNLLLKGYFVNIIIFSQYRDVYWLNKLKRQTDVIVWDPANNTISDFIYKLNEFDLFITSRYHGAIFSALLEKPFITICVEQKLELISDIYHKCSKKWCYPFNIDECVDFVSDINKNYKTYQKEIILINTKQRKLAKEMFNEFINYTII